MEVTRAGFRKQIIQSMRIDSSEPAPMTITMQVTNVDCGDSFSRVTYVDATGESSIRGVISGGKKRVESSAGLLSGATVSVLRSGSKGKGLAVLTNENGEFDFVGLEPGLYLLRASRKGYADFAVSNVRVRPGKTLQVQFSMYPSEYTLVCQ
jgi:Carboxypeptidase regulatory-like domain